MSNKLGKTDDEKPKVEEPKKIDLSKTLTIVLTYPENTIPMEMTYWFMRSGFQVDKIGFVCEKAPFDVIRNKIMKNIRGALDKFEWILFADNDMRPYKATDMFLFEQDGFDVVACNYDTNPTATITPEAFHMGLIRIKTSILKKVMELSDKDKKPIFFMPRSPDHTQIVGCECNWFAGRLKEVGAKIMRIGHCNHYKIPRPTPQAPMQQCSQKQIKEGGN